MQNTNNICMTNIIDQCFIEIFKNYDEWDLYTDIDSIGYILGFTLNEFDEYINISAKELLECNDYKIFWHNKVTELHNLIYGDNYE